MTESRKYKRRVRERMAATGETYTAAKRAVDAERSREPCYVPAGSTARRVDSSPCYVPAASLRTEHVPESKVLVQDYDEAGNMIGEPYEATLAAHTVIKGTIR
jgi:hypothetical protein